MHPSWRTVMSMVQVGRRTSEFPSQCAGWQRGGKNVTLTHVGNKEVSPWRRTTLG